VDPIAEKAPESRIPYLAAGDAPSAVAKRLNALPDLNVFKLLAHAHGTFDAWLRFGGSLLSDLALDDELRELAILRVARLTPHAEYEWVQHVAIARSVGATDAQIAALERDDPTAEAFSAPERAVLAFTTEVVRNARASDATLAALGEFLSPREIVELLMVIGQYMMVARVMATTHMELDEPVDPAALRAR
jgi:alkylhydroperoxidase family enzyme